MIESPTAVLFEPLPDNDPDAPVDGKKGGQVEADLILVKQQPITAKFRSTLKHLRARAGVWSRFRAMSLFLFYSVSLGRLTLLLRNVLRVPQGLDGVLASVLLARIQMGWTHIAISDPSPKYWFRRLPSIKLWKKVVIPTALHAAAQQVTILLPAALACTLGLKKAFEPEVLVNMSDSERNMLFGKGLLVVFVAIFCAVAVVVPASVALTRVQASLLTEEEETIVPFDRSFGGRVIPAIVGGSGVIGALDAWKTFDWNSRVRLLKMYAKALVIQVSVALLFGLVLGMELNFFMSAEIQKFVMIARGKN